MRIRCGRATVIGDRCCTCHWGDRNLGRRARWNDPKARRRGHYIKLNLYASTPLQELIMHTTRTFSLPRRIRMFGIVLALLAVMLTPLAAAGAEESSTSPDLPAAVPSEAEQARYPMTFTDDLGVEVVLERRPESVLSLSLFSDEVLMEMLPAESFAAVTSMTVNPVYSNVAEQAAGMEPVIEFNVEQIISLYPDLVIAANWSEAGKVEQLRQAGIPVYQINTPSNIAEIKAAVVQLGELVGRTTEAEELNARMDQDLHDLAARVGALKDDERLSAIDYNSWGSANGGNTTWDLVLELAGIENAVGDMEVGDFGQVQLSKEVLIEVDPDILFLPSYIWGEDGAADAFYRQTVEDPALAGVQAIEDDRVYIFPERLKGSYSQYLVQAAWAASEMAYPDLFAE